MSVDTGEARRLTERLVREVTPLREEDLDPDLGSSLDTLLVLRIPRLLNDLDTLAAQLGERDQRIAELERERQAAP